jgi:RimJ/RimL family protein N-acetyltransferase
MLKDSLTFRLATIDDADLLLLWRNDTVTRQFSHNPNPIQLETHMTWLQTVLDNTQQHLWIVEDKGTPVGTVRAFFVNNGYELSWTVAPNQRGRGYGKRMVALLASTIDGPITTQVRRENEASKTIAESAGMQLVKIENDILYFARKGKE